MSAGARNKLVTLQRHSSKQDGYGQAVDKWTAIEDVWAAVNYGRGDERRQAAMEQGQQAATFTVLDNDTTRSVTIKDRILHAGGEWDITSNVPARKAGERDITAATTL